MIHLEGNSNATLQQAHGSVCNLYFLGDGKEKHNHFQFVWTKYIN